MINRIKTIPCSSKPATDLKIVTATGLEMGLRGVGVGVGAGAGAAWGGAGDVTAPLRDAAPRYLTAVGGLARLRGHLAASRLTQCAHTRTRLTAGRLTTWHTHTHTHRLLPGQI